MLEHGSYYSPSGDLRIDVEGPFLNECFRVMVSQCSPLSGWVRIGYASGLCLADAAALVAGFTRKEQA